MDRRNCEECIFYDICDSHSVCNYYSVDDIIDDYTIEKDIEEGRIEYYDEWILYVTEYDDDYFLN